MERRALAALAILLLTGCTQSGPLSRSELPYESTPDLYHAPSNLGQLTQRLRQASYLIECGATYGSGFGYSVHWGDVTYDFIVTTETVVSECLETGTHATISDSDWSTFSAEVLVSEKESGTSSSFSVNQDFAILKPIGTKIATFEEDADSLRIGSWVMTASFPALNADYFSWTVTHGTLASNLQNLGYAISTPTNAGNNGGVVVNSRGEVVGMRYTPSTKAGEGFGHMLAFRQSDRLFHQVRDLFAELDAEPRLG